jgi:hypothetical protein
MVELMIAEEVDDCGLDGVGGGDGNADDAHDIARHGVVDPIEQALINHDLARVGALGNGWGGGNVGGQPELADHRIKEAPPLLVIRVHDVEDHQDVGFEGRLWLEEEEEAGAPGVRHRRTGR